jgi:endosialidase-like protein
VATDGRYIETSTGAYLSDGGDWVNSSDVNRKENFRHEEGETVLTKVSRLPIQSWNYKAESPSVRHVGPTAQDFYAAFHLGDTDKAIGTVDIGGVNLLGIQALERRTRDHMAEIEALRAEVAALRAEVAQRLVVLDSLLGRAATRDR